MSDERQTVTVQFDKSDVVKMKDVAKIKDKSVSAVIRTAVKKQLSEEDSTKG